MIEKQSFSGQDPSTAKLKESVGCHRKSFICTNIFSSQAQVTDGATGQASIISVSDVVRFLVKSNIRSPFPLRNLFLGPHPGCRRVLVGWEQSCPPTSSSNNSEGSSRDGRLSLRRHRSCPKTYPLIPSLRKLITRSPHQRSQSPLDQDKQ